MEASEGIDLQQWLNTWLGRHRITDYQYYPTTQDELQIPSTLRPKLATMDPTVKAAFLKSSHVLTQMKPATTTAPMTPRTLRRVQSSESMLSSPRPQKPLLEEYDLTNAHNLPFGTGHSRGKSLDVRRQVLEPKATQVAPLKVAKDKKKTAAMTPEKYVRILLGQSSTAMDIEIVKKLRLLLRNESARYVVLTLLFLVATDQRHSWTETFLQHGGYDAILTRLNELLEVEWRQVIILGRVCRDSCLV